MWHCNFCEKSPIYFSLPHVASLPHAGPAPRAHVPEESLQGSFCKYYDATCQLHDFRNFCSLKTSSVPQVQDIAT
jgi:hypothetical protein